MAETPKKEAARPQIWRVVARRQGQYNQVLREPGEVFDLLLYADGTYPVAVRYEPKRDEAGKPIPDEWNEIQIKGKDGVLVHRDFAEHLGSKLVTKGPKKGEVLEFGWMTRVPERTPLGQYPAETDFWKRGIQLPPSYEVVPADPRRRGAEDYRRNHAPILDVLPPEVQSDVEEYVS